MSKSIFRTILFTLSFLYGSIALSQDERQSSFFFPELYQSRKMIKVQNSYIADSLSVSDTIRKVYDISIEQDQGKICISSFAPANLKKYKIVRTELENGQKRYICKVWQSDVEYTIWVSSDQNQLIVIEGQDRLVYILEPIEARYY